jgi:hypothetical protein
MQIRARPYSSPATHFRDTAVPVAPGPGAGGFIGAHAVIENAALITRDAAPGTGPIFPASY